MCEHDNERYEEYWKDNGERDECEEDENPEWNIRYKKPDTYDKDLRKKKCIPGIYGREPFGPIVENQNSEEKEGKESGDHVPCKER